MSHKASGILANVKSALTWFYPSFQDKENTDKFAIIPHEILLQIFMLLSFKDLSSVSLANRRCYCISQSFEIYKGALEESVPHSFKEPWITKAAQEKGWDYVFKIVCGIPPAKLSFTSPTHCLLKCMKEGCIAIEGDVFALSEKGNLSAWNLVTRKLLFSLNMFKTGSFALHNGFLLQSYREDKRWKMQVVDAKTGEVTARFRGNSNRKPAGIAMHNALVAKIIGHVVKIGDTEKGIFYRTLFGHSKAVNSIAFGEDILVSGSDDNSVKVWSTETWECIATLCGRATAKGGILSVAVQDNYVVAGGEEGQVYIWDLAKRELVYGFYLSICSNVRKLFIKNNLIILSCDPQKNNPNVVVWDFKNKNFLNRYYTNFPASIAFQGEILAFVQKNSSYSRGKYRLKNVRIF